MAPVCPIADCQYHFNALEYQVLVCINCHLIDFKSNLANCRWGIGTLLFGTLILFNDPTNALHRNSQPPPSTPDNQCPIPLSHTKWRTFIRRPHNLLKEVMRIERPNSMTMDPEFQPELGKRGLSTVNKLRPKNRDLDNAISMRTSSKDKKLWSKNWREPYWKFMEWIRTTPNLMTMHRFILTLRGQGIRPSQNLITPCHVKPPRECQTRSTANL